MKRKSIGTLLVLLLYVLTLLHKPVESWTYNDETPEDTIYEKFGPRADKLLIKLYENETLEWDALARGEIDITDWPLTRTWHDLFVSNTTNPATGSPYNETVNTVKYGSERRFFILDLNNDPRKYLSSPDPSVPNPAYPNPCSVIEFRQAIAYLVNRSQLDTIIGSRFYTPLYTVVPPYMGSYSHPDIKPGGLLENLTYPNSRANAEAILDATGFPINSSTGWRYWDQNSDGAEQSDEYLELNFVIRKDDPHQLAFGNFIADELEAVKVRVDRRKLELDAVTLSIIERNFHLCTGGWTLGIDPDHLLLWHSKSYWTGLCLNYAYVNDTELDCYIDGVVNAGSSEQALENAWGAQRRLAEIAAGIPVWTSEGFLAVNRNYTGGNAGQPADPDDGENNYRGQHWKGLVNEQLYGVDSFWSFLNMYPDNYEKGDGENMTIRWGFRVDYIAMLNPVYSTGLWDWNVLDLIYEPLLKRSPYNTADFVPWLTESFELRNYTHPVNGQCTKIEFKLRSDITWHDGTPLTAADVYFTWFELPRILEDRGLPPPPSVTTWYPILDFKLLDPYNFELLLDDQDIWVLSLISSKVILPKHIWKPISETGPIHNFAPDPNLIGSGPWRLKEYVESSHALLVANSPNRAVQTNLLGSTPITSSNGYHRYYPVTAKSMIDETTAVKIDYYDQPHTIDYIIYNMYYGPTTVNITIIYPNGTTYSETGVTIPVDGNWTHSWSGEVKHTDTTRIVANITNPTVLQGTYSWIQVYYGTAIFYDTIYHTMMVTDVAGSTFYDDTGLIDYPFKNQLPTPDIKIDMRDIAILARSFGSYPGNPRWNMGVGDINNDYKINMRDIGGVARQFGWSG